MADALSEVERQPLGALTRQELVVLSLVADGMTNQGIADHLVITKRAVEKHLGNVFRKLGLANDTGDKRVEATLLHQRHAGGDIGTDT